MTKRWEFPAIPRPAQADEIAAVLLAAGVVLMPTDTIYGLHALASDEGAVGRIAAIKGRDDTKPFIVLASSIQQLRDLGTTVREDDLHALDSIWPAPLTVILPVRAPLPASRGAATVAVRIPALPWLRELVSRTGPLVSTSANRSGEPPVRSPLDFARELQERVDAIADGGVCEGKPSTLLDLTGDEPRLVRESDSSFTQLVWKRLRKSR